MFQCTKILVKFVYLVDILQRLNSTYKLMNARPEMQSLHAERHDYFICEKNLNLDEFEK